MHIRSGPIAAEWASAGQSYERAMCAKVSMYTHATSIFSPEESLESGELRFWFHATESEILFSGAFRRRTQGAAKTRLDTANWPLKTKLTAKLYHNQIYLPCCNKKNQWNKKIWKIMISHDFSYFWIYLKRENISWIICLFDHWSWELGISYSISNAEVWSTKFYT